MVCAKNVNFLDRTLSHLYNLLNSGVIDVIPQTKMTGIVKSWGKTHGFIIADRPLPTDVFAHYSAIGGPTGHKSLIVGQPVEFDLIQGPRGLIAQNIRALPIRMTA